MKSTGMSIVAVLGLVTAGFGGYNLVTTGCPLGSCEAPTALTNVSTTSGSGEHTCSLGCSEHAPTPIDVVAAANCSETKACTDATASACCAGDAATKAAKLAKGESCCGNCTSKTEAGKDATCPVTGETAKKDDASKADPKQPA